jgi:hypothetical protein
MQSDRIIAKCHTEHIASNRCSSPALIRSDWMDSRNCARHPKSKMIPAMTILRGVYKDGIPVPVMDTKGKDAHRLSARISSAVKDSPYGDKS